MFYPDYMIREWAENGGIDPYESENINPASIDLRISNMIRIPITPGIGESFWSDPFEAKKINFSENGFILCSTIEYVKMPKDAVGLLFLKSSAGRKGLEHLHAGYVDPGFEGNLTLELQNCWPGIQTVISGDRLLQLTLSPLVGGKCERDYSKTGHYQGQRGPTPQWR